MYRRTVLAALGGALLPLWSWAHHGWEAYDQSRPVYLEGIVSTITWADPHVEVELQLDPEARVPLDLATRVVPKQQYDIDLRKVLGQAVVPVLGDRQWRVFLAPLARLAVWEVPRPKVGDRIAVVGYMGPREKGDPAVRAEILFIGEKAYPLRSGPANGSSSNGSSR